MTENHETRGGLLSENNDW